MKHSLAMKSKNQFDSRESNIISMTVQSEKAPRYLSDFAGGMGSLSAGYQDTEDQFTVKKNNTHSVTLSFNNGSTYNLSSREACELHLGQYLYLTQAGEYQATSYEITIIP